METSRKEGENVPGICRAGGGVRFTAKFRSHFMHIVQNSAGDAHHKHLEVAPSTVFHAARDVHNNAFHERDALVIELHFTLAVEDVVNLVRAFMIMQPGVGDFEVVNFCRSPVLFLEQRADLPARFSPRCDLRAVAADEGGSGWHKREGAG